MRDEGINVVMMPNYTKDNPYQTLLADGVKASNVFVVLPHHYRRVLPFLRFVKSSCSEPVQLLHLHWYEPFWKGERVWERLFYLGKILIDLWLLKQTGVKLVWTVHNELSHEARFHRMEQCLRRGLARLADRVIVHSHSVIGSMQKQLALSSHKIAVVPHGHYRSAYAQSELGKDVRAQLGLPERGRIFMNLGMMRAYKGVESLLAAWAEHCKRFPEDTLLLAGEAQSDDYGQHLAQAVNRVEGVIWHQGFVPQEKIADYYRAADVVVLPFQRTLTSGSLLLAMSFDRPVIAPRAGNIPEALGNADALLYDIGEEEGLLKALARATTVDLAELSQRTRIACDQLDWDSVGEKTAQVYHEALQNS